MQTIPQTFDELCDNMIVISDKVINQLNMINDMIVDVVEEAVNMVDKFNHPEKITVADKEA